MAIPAIYLEARSRASTSATDDLLLWEGQIRSEYDPDAPDSYRDLRVLAAIRYELADRGVLRLDPRSRPRRQVS